MRTSLFEVRCFKLCANGQRMYIINTKHKGYILPYRKFEKRNDHLQLFINKKIVVSRTLLAPSLMWFFIKVPVTTSTELLTSEKFKKKFVFRRVGYFFYWSLVFRKKDLLPY